MKQTAGQGAFDATFEAPLVGTDEVGVGALAGPIVAAAVHLFSSISREVLHAIDDSKRLRPQKRIQLLESLRPHALFSIGLAPARTVDSLNPYRASEVAMERALYHLSRHKRHFKSVLVDGTHVLSVTPIFPSARCIAVPHGDRRSASIAAASIVAKVYRDRCMMKLDRFYPAYNFCKNVGYPTAQHLEALRRLGPCRHHRKTYRPVKEALHAQ